MHPPQAALKDNILLRSGSMKKRDICRISAVEPPPGILQILPDRSYIMSFTLETPRLIIRSFAAGDEPLYVSTHQDPLVNKYLPVRSEEQYREVFQQALVQPDASLNRWAITAREDGAYIGSCLLREFNPGEEHVIELGYSLAAEHWGKGYAREMIAGMIAYAFSLKQTYKLVAVTHPENKGSQAVLQKNGFVCRGEVVRYDNLKLTYFEYAPGAA
ncbi:GNAT family N-acetyltransferase [Taibaiella helva]|uniref:GNAT family N-acetyltransferase n=1 Tax=Taibaiella helva TaxID=2301235 RepID=UPI00293720C6|nr:GNAT family N-acetyltransferase [Taibaiella helva]